MTSVLQKINGSIDNDTNNQAAIDITDILQICEQYSVLGWSIQQQIRCLIEDGIEETVNSGRVNNEVLPYIREFLKGITERIVNADVVDQAYLLLMMIDDYELKHPQAFKKQTKN